MANAGAPEALLQVLREAEGMHAPAVAAAACNAMRRIAVNDDICGECAELGGVQATMQVPPPFFRPDTHPLRLSGKLAAHLQSILAFPLR